MSEKYKLYPNIFLTKGFNRTLMCDFQRGITKIFPNEFNLMFDDSNFLIDEILGTENFDYLLEEELIFKVNPRIKYNEIETHYESPCSINNAIVYVSKLTLNYLSHILNFLEIQNTYQVQIIFDSKEVELNLIQKHLISRSIDKFELIDIQNNTIEQQLKSEFINTNQANCKVLCNFKKHCGNFNLKSFSSAQEHFFESQSHNTCLNKKIAIDVNGDIKNCPSMKQSFGNIKDTTLEQASNHPDFKKLWDIKKDDIKVCKDCEFRHICTDCRAYTEDPEDIYSKPLKCGYNPYTNEWEEWSTNPLKQKAIEYYGFKDLVK